MYDSLPSIILRSSLEHTIPLYTSILFVLGAIIGSFLNMVIYRLPLMLEGLPHNYSLDELDKHTIQNPQSDKIINSKPLTLLYPRSHCIKCKKSIPFWLNIPILGYFLAKGKCVYCKTKFSISYPLIELTTGLLFVIAGYVALDVIQLLLFFIFISFMICIICIDFKTFLLPDQLTLPLLWIGFLFQLFADSANGKCAIKEAVIGAMLGYLILFSISWVFKLITKKDGMGHGDFKLLAAFGAWFTYFSIIPILLISSILGIVYFILAKITGKLKQHSMISGAHIPFGPFLAITGLILLLFPLPINILMYVSLIYLEGSSWLTVLMSPIDWLRGLIS